MISQWLKGIWKMINKMLQCKSFSSSPVFNRCDNQLLQKIKKTITNNEKSTLINKEALCTSLSLVANLLSWMNLISALRSNPILTYSIIVITVWNSA
jgi:hypothetical protein